MIFALLPPRISPVIFPPYYPPEIQKISGWMKENELMMSDVPWAVAWYGQRQCVWLTLDPKDEFAAINKNMKPISALYLTPKTMDAKFISDWALARDKSWGNFIFMAVTQNQVPPDFPLRHAPAGFLPERMFLADDQKRWKRQNETAAENSRRRAAQPVGDARPFRQIRRRFDDNQFRARLVATMQFRVKRPRKRLRIVGNHADARKISPEGIFVCAMM